MIFFAHYLNSDVIDSTETTVGRLKDMVVRTGDEYPEVQALVLEHGNKNIFIPVDDIENLGFPEITLKKRFQKIDQYKQNDKDFWIYRDVVDKQIVDISGTRVVRVNDIQLGKVNQELRVLAIDISLKGLFRRLGMDKWRMLKFMDPRLIDWKNIQLVNGSLKLNTVSKDLQKLHAADLANIVEELNPKQGMSIMNALEPEKAAKVFQELTPAQRRVLMEILGESKAKEMLENVPDDDVVDFIKTVDYDDAKKVLSYLHKDRKGTIQKFIKYPNDTAGGLMTSEFVRVDPNWTVDETIKYVKKVSHDFRSIFFVYLVDKDDKLHGVVSARTLLVKDLDLPMKKVMKSLRKIHIVHPHTNVRKVAEIMTKYNLFSIAVVDKNKLLGIVTVDDVMRCLMPHS